MSAADPRNSRFSDLGLRAASSLALATIALVDLWLGGLWVAVLAAIAVAVMLWELHRMVSGSGGVTDPCLVAAALAGAAAVFVASPAGTSWAAACLAGGAALVLMLARRPVSFWMAGGLVYAGFALAYLTVIRETPGLGFHALLWLILVVAAADIGAYFVGRAVGGPKLWLRVSPGKTWSGALGGQAIAVVVGVLVGSLLGWRPLAAALVSLGVAIASQAGDLLKSAVKRRHGVKDASRLIPGHGGVMDRIDGLMGALWFLALYDLFGGRLGT
jgi:phosphatidate cytidylyltransferase